MVTRRELDQLRNALRAKNALVRVTKILDKLEEKLLVKERTVGKKTFIEIKSKELINGRWVVGTRTVVGALYFDGLLALHIELGTRRFVVTHVPSGKVLMIGTKTNLKAALMFLEGHMTSLMQEKLKEQKPMDLFSEQEMEILQKTREIANGI